MRVLVTGAGQGGTSWCAEVVKCTGLFDWFSEGPEDRNFPYRATLPERYGTKLATENDDCDFIPISRLLETHDDLRIVFVTRHPYDNWMSKVIRGLPASEGGDKHNPNDQSYTYTTETALQAVGRAYELYAALEYRYEDRLLHLKMEDFIMDMKDVFYDIHLFFDISPRQATFDAMMKAHANNVNRFHKSRYGNEVDESQVDIWKRWETAYGGYFKDKGRLIKSAFTLLTPIARAWGYDTIS